VIGKNDISLIKYLLNIIVMPFGQIEKKTRFRLNRPMYSRKKKEKRPDDP
jgi:hypothetical protein